VPPKTYTTGALQANMLKRGQRVKLVSDLPQMPAGSEGKVALSNGFTWVRYWVRFNNGEVVGHIDHADLVRSKDFARFCVAREREAAQAEIAAVEAADAGESAAATDAGVAGSGGSGEAVVNGVTVPAYLLQRSADARARLTA